MTGAVRFNGNTFLVNKTIGASGAFPDAYACATISYWYKATAVDNPGDAQIIVAFNTAAGRHQMRVFHLKRSFGARQLSIIPQSASSSLLNFITTSTLELIYDGEWHSIVIGINTTINYCVARQDNVDMGMVMASPSPAGFSIDYSGSDWQVGSADGQTFKGCLSNVFYYAHNNSVFTVFETPTFSSFRTNDNHALDLGPNGSAIFGLEPQICLQGNAAEFPKNHGAGGQFLIAGNRLLAILTDCDNDPFPSPRAVILDGRTTMSWR